MPIARVQLADGRVARFDVPEGTTPEQVEALAARQDFGVAPEPSVPDEVVQQVVEQPEAIAPQPPESVQADVSQATQEAAEILNLDKDIIERATILPFGKTQSGETVLAIPEIALEVGRAILLPGQVAAGTPFTEADVTTAALATGLPALRGVRATRGTRRLGKITAQQIADAPASVDITKASGKKFTAAKQANASLNPDDYVGFLAGAERDLIEEGADAALHPKLTAVFNALTKRFGQSLDATDLHNVRRTIGIATESLEPDEARIARVLRNNFDDFVENLPGTEEWRAARNLYIRARKAETVERVIEKAGRQTSGVENGLRIGFRALLNDPRKLRNFTKAEKAAMEAVVDGDFTTNTLKKIGRLSFGTGQQSGFLGGSIGIIGGGALAGPVGGAAAPIVGFAAQKGAQRRTQRAANVLQALTTGARPEPRTVLRDVQAVPRAVAGAAAATQIEEDERLRRAGGA